MRTIVILLLTLTLSSFTMAAQPTEAEATLTKVVRLIGELGPSAREAVPVLCHLRYSRGIMIHDYAEDALAAVAPEYIRDPWRK